VTIRDLVANDDVEYKLSTAGEGDFLNAFSASDDVSATFTVTSGTGTYTASGKSDGVTYTGGVTEGTSLTYHAATTRDTVAITNLGMAAGDYTVTESGGVISITNGQTGATLETYATIDASKKISLKLGALPTGNNLTQKTTIALSNNTNGYTLALANDNNIPTAQWTVKDAATFDGSKFTAPKYSEYFTNGANNTIDCYKSLGGEEITFTTSGTVDAISAVELAINNTSGDTTTVNGLFTVKAETTDNSTVTYTVTPTSEFVVKIKQGGSITVSGATFGTFTAPTSDVIVTNDAKFAQDTADNTRYVYTAKIDTADKFEFDSTTAIANTKINHTPQVGGQKFELSGNGLATNLHLDGNNIYKGDDKNNIVGTIDFKKTTAPVVRLTSTSVFANLTADHTVKLTDITEGIGEVGDNAVTYTLQLNTAFNYDSAYSESSKPDDTPATFTGNNTTYTYTASHTPAYTSSDGATEPTYTYHAEATPADKFTISGTGLATFDETTEFNSYISFTPGETKVTLTETALANATGNITIADSGSATSKTYTLDTSGVATAAFTAASGDNGSIDANGKYTTPAFQKYYTGQNSATLTAHAATDSQTPFTISGLSGTFTCEYNNGTTTIKSGETTIGTITLTND
ncbi:MAG: hypothetical protein J5497_06200, partial [Selenomonadaceae bacterium]|nr:hypothetical protein [Selenomonadaceae bacterium]